MLLSLSYVVPVAEKFPFAGLKFQWQLDNVATMLSVMPDCKL